MAATLVLLPLAAPFILGAQSAPPPSFDVASVRQDTRHSWVRRPWTPNIDCAPIGQCGVSGSRFTEEFASLDDLIMDAYKVKRYQIANLPKWGDTGQDVYDIDARVEGDRTPTLDEARQMLQTLLADRFQLKLHHETRELPVYALVVGKNGPKLAPRRDPCTLPGLVVRDGPGRGGNTGGDERGGAGAGRDAKDGDKKGGDKGGGGKDLGFIQTWAIIPEILSGMTDRPVIDRTGLEEPAYCTLDGQDPLMTVIMQVGPLGGGRGGDPENRTAIPDPGSTGASIFTAVEEKWGLKLEPQKAPVDVLVIDRVERPSEN
jgi:uncharacterized protein (TIGR03435 family)